MNTINLPSIRTNGCLPFFLIALPALTLPALFLHPGGLTWVMLESVTSFFKNALGGATVAFDILREGNLTTYIFMLWIFLGIAAVHFVGSLKIKGKGHKHFGTDKKRRDKSGRNSADTGSDKDHYINKKKARNRKKQKNSKNRNTSKSDTSLDDLKKFNKQKKKSLDNNDSDDENNVPSSLSGTDIEENNSKQNRDSSSSISSTASSTISRSDDDGVTGTADFIANNDAVHISESKSKDIVDKNSISDVVKEKLIVETANEKKAKFSSTSITSWADAVSSDEEDNTPSTNNNISGKSTKSVKRNNKSKKNKTSTSSSFDKSSSTKAGSSSSSSSNDNFQSKKKKSIANKKERKEKGIRKSSGTNRRNDQQEVENRSSHFEKGSGNNKYDPNSGMSTNGYTKDNGRNYNKNNRRNNNNNSNSRSSSRNNNSDANTLNPYANDYVYEKSNNNFYNNDGQQYSNTGNTKYIYEMSEQDKAMAQQVQIQQEILHQQKIQQEKMMEEMRLRYPEQMAQYEQQQFIIQQQHFIEQQQARLNMAIQSQLQQHQQQQNSGNMSINNNDHMLRAEDANANVKQRADINNVNVMHDMTSANSNNNVHDINFVENVVPATEHNNVTANNVTNGNVNASIKATTTPVNSKTRSGKRPGSVFKAQELAFDMATSLFDD